MIRIKKIMTMCGNIMIQIKELLLNIN